MQKEKIWTSTFTLTMGISFIFYLVFYLLTVIIGTVAMTQDHAPASLAGILSGIFIVGSFIGRLWGGTKISDFGAKKMLYVGIIFYLIMNIFYLFVSNIWLLLVIRFLHGIGFGIAGTATGTLAGLVVPASRRGEGIGYFTLSLTLASAVGPFLSIFLYHTFNYQVLLILSVALLAISLLASFFLKIPQHVVDAMAQTEKKAFSLGSLFEVSALPMGFIGLLIGVAYASLLTFLANFTAGVGLVTAGSLFYVVYALFILVSRPLTGRLFDSKGDNFVMYPTFILFAIGLVLTGFSHTSLMLFGAAALVGLGYGSFTPFGQAISIRNVSADRIGVATSTFFGLYDMGVGLGPFFLGLIVPMSGYRNLYFGCAIFTLIVMGIYWLIHGRKQNKLA
ncbi:MFS transporter [Lactococcus termiticola]|uniref:Major facilitator superfamily transporter n=1 Tax=Lactococcus termiticola TaxID=2169526 RepID=A0A2R5HHB6_9LACT|nr:MFS transporter [Lactococcus termiticola]GBG97457.1 major facilitator superfamily transporter [Lactococcus termiticola]